MGKIEIFIFLCRSDTRQECLDKMLVGTTQKIWDSDFEEKLVNDSKLLIYDYSKY